MWFTLWNAWDVLGSGKKRDIQSTDPPSRSGPASPSHIFYIAPCNRWPWRRGAAADEVYVVGGLGRFM